MSYITDLRSLMYDTGATGRPKRFTDADLIVYGNIAVDDLNSWTENTYLFADIDDPLLVPIKFRTLALGLSAILGIEADRSSAAQRMKFVTQDTQVDPGSGFGLTTYLKQLEDRWMLRLKKWYGIDHGGFAGILDQQIETDATA